MANRKNSTTNPPANLTTADVASSLNEKPYARPTEEALADPTVNPWTGERLPTEVQLVETDWNHFLITLESVSCHHGLDDADRAAVARAHSILNAAYESAFRSEYATRGVLAKCLGLTSIRRIRDRERNWHIANMMAEKLSSGRYKSKEAAARECISELEKHTRSLAGELNTRRFTQAHREHVRTAAFPEMVCAYDIDRLALLLTKRSLSY